MSTEITPLSGNLPSSPLPFGVDTSPAAGTGELNPLVRIISAFKRFKWLILLCTLLGIGAGVMATRFMPEKYEVGGVIMLEARGGNTGVIEAAPFLQGTQWIELLKDPRVLDPVVKELKLYVVGPNPRNADNSREGPSGLAATLFEGFETGEQFIPGNYTVKFSEDGTRWEMRNVTQGPVRENGTVGDSAGLQWGIKWVPRPRQSMRGQEFEFTLLTPRPPATAP